MILDNQICSNIALTSLWQGHSRLNVCKGPLGLWNTLAISSPVCHFSHPSTMPEGHSEGVTMPFWNSWHCYSPRLSIHGTSHLQTYFIDTGLPPPSLTSQISLKATVLLLWQCPSSWPNEGRNGICRWAGLLPKASGQPDLWRPTKVS